jgi:histidinol-phosphate phosphatase family protein
MTNKAVFVDRDGTINVNVEYLDNSREFQMYPGVAEGIKLLNENGFLIIIVTNQSGIARGYYTKETLDKIHERMISEFEEKGAKIDGLYYCPHHPDDNCNCRKPRTGMLEKAIHDFEIDTSKSFIIGDRMIDIEAGYKMGLKTVIVPERVKIVKKEIKESKISPDFYCDDFLTGIKWILNNY